MIDATNRGEWKARIERPVCSDRLNIWLYRPGKYKDETEIAQPDGMMWILKDGQERPDECRPTFVLSGFDARQMMHALSEALAEEGVKTPDSHRLQGMLDAQKAHLEDLRALLKLK